MENQDSINDEYLVNGKKLEKKKYFQIDLLKTYVIFIVIFDHSIPYNIIISLGGIAWERIVIPVLLIILAFNLGNSFKNDGKITLKEIYNKSYFKKKFKRYIIPYIIFYAISIIIYLIMVFIFQNTYIHPYFDDKMFIVMGYTPFWGPGMWFIPIILSSIFIIPIFYHFFSKDPILTLFFCFFIEFFFHLIIHLIYGIIGFNNTINFFYCNLLLYSFSIGVGLWLTRNHKLNAKENRFILILLPISILYFIEYTIFGFSKYFIIGDYNFLTVPFSAFIFMLTMKYIPKNPQNKLAKLISRIGKSTYHIFLFQILYFSIIYHVIPDIAFNGFGSFLGIYPIYYAFNLFINMLGGLLWYELDVKITNIRKIANISLKK